MVYTDGYYAGCDNGTGYVTLKSNAGNTCKKVINVGLPSTYTVRSDSVGKIIRAEPNCSAAKVYTGIPAGTTVSITDASYNANDTDGQRRIWGKTTYNGYTGWFEMWLV